MPRREKLLATAHEVVDLLRGAWHLRREANQLLLGQQERVLDADADPRILLHRGADLFAEGAILRRVGELFEGFRTNVKARLDHERHAGKASLSTEPFISVASFAGDHSGVCRICDPRGGARLGGLMGATADHALSRLEEFALHMAIGARPARILADLLRQAAPIMGAGAATGALLSRRRRWGPEEALGLGITEVE
jgi:hypothetical protein